MRFGAKARIDFADPVQVLRQFEKRLILGQISDEMHESSDEHACENQILNWFGRVRFGTMKKRVILGNSHQGPGAGARSRAENADARRPKLLLQGFFDKCARMATIQYNEHVFVGNV
jgi:hypothetical protein